MHCFVLFQSVGCLCRGKRRTFPLRQHGDSVAVSVYDSFGLPCPFGSELRLGREAFACNAKNISSARLFGVRYSDESGRRIPRRSENDISALRQRRADRKTVTKDAAFLRQFGTCIYNRCSRRNNAVRQKMRDYPFSVPDRSLPADRIFFSVCRSEDCAFRQKN